METETNKTNEQNNSADLTSARIAELGGRVVQENKVVQNENKTEVPTTENIQNQPEVKKEEKTEFNWTDFGENFKSKDDIKNALKDIETLRKNSEEATKNRQEAEELKNKLSTFENPFANETLEKLNALLKTNKDADINSYMKLLTTDIDKLTPIERIKLSYSFENPELTKDEIESYLSSQYILDDQEVKNEDGEVDEVKTKERKSKYVADKVKLTLEAKEASKKLKGIVDNIKLEKPLSKEQTEALIKQKEESFKKYSDAWNTVSEKFIEKNIKSIKIPIHENDKVEDFMNYDIPVNEHKKYAKLASDVLTSVNIPLEEKSLPLLEKVIKDNYILDNLPKIIYAATDKARKMTNDEWAKKVNNPSALRGATQNTDLNERNKPTSKEDIYQKVMNSEAGIK